MLPLQSQEVAAAWESRNLNPDLYINRYRNAWPAAVQGLKQYIETEQRKKRSGLGALPAPMPLSKFQWAQGQGKGLRSYSKCGACLHCSRPQMKKACLAPVAKDGDQADLEANKVCY